MEGRRGRNPERKKGMEKKSKFKEWLLWLMVGTSLVLMVYNTSARWAANSRTQRPLAAQVKTGEHLANFQLKHTDDRDFFIPGNGRYLLSFMTTKCGACQKQVNSLNELARSTKDYAGVGAVFFEPANKVREFRSSFNPAFTCLLDHNGQLASKLQINTFPQTIELVDGVVIKSWVGLQTRFE